MSSKLLMLTKASVESFVYDIIDICFLDDRMKDIFDQNKIIKCLTDTDFIYLFIYLFSIYLSLTIEITLLIFA